jgi:rhodanese-related sulfurtransferase
MKISRTYLILSIVLVSLALILVILPPTTRNKEINPELLLKEINNPARFLSPDLIAERLINEDPTLLLVDVRSNDQFSKFSLPGAINIPLSEIGKADWERKLNQQEKDVIFFSNDALYADQAWILCARLGYKNLNVIKGGLNQWFTDVIFAQKPSETASKEEFELYTFRKAAGLYFSGGSKTIKNEDPRQITIIKREKKTAATGGC